ncbi:hypothetical protein [Xanthomonas citri]|uniref:hypothetical protein n=1 Tax=Xanthomonas citri TaxID=346 RepID=UPI0004E6DD80|nr:hypothetical protein [Xanthomonas citri]WPM77387.1 hypothetical protein XVT_04005 [Xanthomonas citri pv. viticola]
MHDTDIGCACTLPHPGYLIAAFAELLAPGFAAMITPGIVLPVLVGETTPCQWPLIKSVDRARWDARSFCNVDLFWSGCQNVASRRYVRMGRAWATECKLDARRTEGRAQPPGGERSHSASPPSAALCSSRVLIDNAV